MRFVLAAASLFTVLAAAQSPDKPLPDIPSLLREVEAHQKTTEALEREYLYRSSAIVHTLDGHGNLKKSELEDSEIFFVAGTRIRRILARDGRPLDPEQTEKENKRIDKEIAHAKERAGQPDARRRDEVTVSRFLELGTFSNPRRLSLNDRDTLAVDFTGDPHAKTQSRFEGALREMAGTLWIDEQERTLRKLEGHFIHPFKVGGGLLADVKEGSSFYAEWTKINGELWLPVSAGGRGDVRVLLLANFHGSLAVTNSGYRKFKATATIVPVTPAAQP